jgi:nucleotide-binding universal stress UspA family protein
MGKHILVPVDESDGAREACEFVEREFPSATVTLLHVINPAEAGYSMEGSLPTASEEWYERKRSDAESLFEDFESELSGTQRTVHTEVEAGKTTNVIVGYAADNDVDQIVMGSHGRSGVSRILLGSVAETVVRRSPVPVTVVR